MNNTCFTKFPNAILEKLVSANLTAREYKVMLCVIRFTFGFHLDGGEPFSITRLRELTGLSRANISRALKKLIERKMILECSEPEFNSSRVISVNPLLDEWETTTVAKMATPTVAKSATPTVAKTATHTSYIKENNKEKYKYKKNELNCDKTPSYNKELFEQMLNRKD